MTKAAGLKVSKKSASADALSLALQAAALPLGGCRADVLCRAIVQSEAGGTVRVQVFRAFGEINALSFVSVLFRKFYDFDFFVFAIFYL